MTTTDLLLIGAGLAMDAAAVSMTNGMVYRNLNRSMYVAMPLFFGLFQALMPVMGYYTGGFFASFLARCSGIVIFLILGVIGGKMVKEGICDLKENHACGSRDMSLRILLLQSIATSIDAFAVGIGFSAVHMDIWMPALLIGATTTLIVMLAIAIGRRFGDMLGCRAEILGGVLLMIIGIKALI